MCLNKLAGLNSRLKWRWNTGRKQDQQFINAQKRIKNANPFYFGSRIYSVSSPDDYHEMSSTAFPDQETAPA